MSKAIYFEDNEIYTANNVVSAMCNLTSQGVKVFTNESTLPADFNNAFNNLATVGVIAVIGDECQVVDGFKINGGAVVTGHGLVCFDATDIDVSTSGTFYVGLNGTEIYVGNTQPALDYIPFAVITNGNIADARQFAQAKIQAPCYSGGVEYGEITFTDADKNQDDEFIKEYTPQKPLGDNYATRVFLLNQKLSYPYDDNATFQEAKTVDGAIRLIGYQGLATHSITRNGTNIKFIATQTTPQGSTYHGSTIKFLIY